jgi:DNA-directed RNA polymerase sigma subunit (sigma70/sigma32)
MKTICQELFDSKDAIRSFRRRFELARRPYEERIKKILYKNKAGKILTPRELTIMRLRWIDGMDLETAGRKYGVTRERIRQISERVKDQLKRELLRNNITKETLKMFEEVRVFS